MNRHRLHIVLGSVFTFFVLIAVARTTRAQEAAIDCFDDLFCIEPIRSGRKVDIYLRNMLGFELSIELNLKVDNMSVDRELPMSKTLAPYELYRAVRMTGGKRGVQWSYKYSLRWLVGKIDARHDDRFVYSLPWSKGLTFGVGQGYNGAQTHRGKYAIDWDMPVGTEVRAARDGIVIDYKDTFYEGGISDDLRSRANFIGILHSDGTIGQYVHLDYQGVKVKIGNRVRRGDVIARSGNIGFSSGPHLHFEVYTVTSDLDRKTIPVRFMTSTNRAATLVVGEGYTR